MSVTFPKPTPLQVLLILAAVVILQTAYNGTVPLDGDEAYYWVWSRHLQAGYHDHPPMIAAMIWLATQMFGVTAAAIRVVPALCLGGTCFFIWRITDRVWGAEAGFLALVGSLALPVVQMGMTLATPDAPQALFWSATAWYGMEAVAGDRQAGGGRWRDFLLAGLCAGLGMASKYTAVLLPVAVFAVVITRRRDLLTSPKLWAALVVALAAFSPVLWWNATHGMESFAFQIHHGSGKDQGLLWREFGTFLGGLAAMLSPLVLVIAVLALADRRQWWADGRRYFLVVCFAVPMAVFLYKALHVKVQLNWAAPALLTLLPLAAGYVWERKSWKLGGAALVLSLVLVAGLKWPLELGLSGNLNIQNRLFGPEVAARALQGLRQPGDVIFSDHLTRAALLEFLLPDHPAVHIPTDSRFSEYTRWDQGLNWRGMHGLYLSRDQHQDDLPQIFGKAELLQVVNASRFGFRQRQYFIYRVGE